MTLEIFADRLAALRTRLAANQSALKFAQRRRHNWRRRSEARWDRYAEARTEAETEGAGAPESRSLKRLRLRAERAQSRARFWVDRIKMITRKIDHLEVSEASVKRELVKWQRDHRIRFIGENKVRGEGVAAWKLQKAAMLRSERNYLAGNQPGYYSMGGAAPVYSHMLYAYPWGHRYDCSVWNDGINYSCGLESPSGHEYRLGGFTGTEYAESVHVDRRDLLPGDFIIYLRWSGDTVGHHVERILDPDREITMGHGDKAINRNSRFDIFGDGLYVFRRMHAPCPALR